ncbi:hypothetical protein FKM82_028608 [Ascaphus truei]
MKLAYIVLLHLSYLTFLDSVPAGIDTAPELKTSTDAHIHVSRVCKFGVCSTENLGLKFHRVTKGKYPTAPENEKGYGRIRRSVPEHKLLLPNVEVL